jgi:hypothetical protein
MTPGVAAARRGVNTRRKRELAIAANFLCVDCGVCTSAIDEYYMVHNEVWAAAKMRAGMLCIGLP